MSSIQDQIAHYRPNHQTLSAIARISLVTVIGPSGAGKTTLMEGAVKADPDIHLVLSDTSRLPRPGERNGVSYFFRSREEMFHLLNQRAFVQIAPIISGDLYASSPASYGHEGKIAMMAVWADAMFQFRALPFHELRQIFIVPPSFDIWQKRMDVRQFSGEQLDKRLSEAKRSFQFGLEDENLHYVINGDLDEAEAAFLKLAHGHFTPQPLTNSQRAKEIITSILDKL